MARADGFVPAFAGGAVAADDTCDALAARLTMTGDDAGACAREVLDACIDFARALEQVAVHTHAARAWRLLEGAVCALAPEFQ